MLVEIGDRLVDVERRGAAGLHREEQRRRTVQQQLLDVRQHLLGALDRRRHVQDGVGELGIVQFLDGLDPGILARDQAVAGVEIGPGEGDPHRAIAGRSWWSTGRNRSCRTAPPGSARRTARRRTRPCSDRPAGPWRFRAPCRSRIRPVRRCRRHRRAAAMCCRCATMILSRFSTTSSCDSCAMAGTATQASAIASNTRYTVIISPPNRLAINGDCSEPRPPLRLGSSAPRRRD